MRPYLLPLALAVVALSSGRASARPAEEEPDGTAPRGLVGSLQLSTASAARGRVSEVRAGLGTYLLPDLTLNLEGAGGWTAYPDDAARARTWQAGLDLAPRWHFHRGLLGTFFADAAVGFRAFGDPFPEGGARFDAVLRAGLGLSLNLTSSVQLAAGARFLHLSEPSGWGSGSPTFNSLELFLGALLGG